MAANPIFVETEEEIPAVIERIKQSESFDVPLVLPARSRFGQSRFNFQLLRDYGVRLGKRISIISPDPAVQRMAEESGFPAYRAVDQYLPTPAAEPAERPAAARVVPVVTEPLRPADPDFPERKVGAGVVPLTGAALQSGAGPVPAPEAAPVPPPVDDGVQGAPRVVPQLPPAVPLKPRLQPPVRVVPATAGAGEAARRPPRIKIAAPKPLPSRLATQAPSRLVLYAGAILVLLVGMIAMVVYVPSAKVTLVTQAQAYSTDVEISAEPNKTPIRVRTSAVAKEATVGQKATGVKTIQGAVANGTVGYSNNCTTGFIIPDGQVLLGASGVQFAQKGAVTIGPKSIFGPPSTASAPIVAKSPGASGNTGGGAMALQPAGEAGSCLAAVSSATSGGADEQKKTVVSAADVEAARSGLEAQLSKQAMDDLNKQVQSGEKLTDPAVTLATDFKTSRKVDEEGGDFNATMTLKLEGAYYVVDDVNRAFGDAIQKKLAADQQLTGNKAKIDYKIVAATAGGHLTFKGNASGFVAPKLDLAKVKNQLPGKSAARARTDLSRLPGVQSVDIQQSPIKLPILPLVGSRIDLQYVVSQAPPTRSG